MYYIVDVIYAKIFYFFEKEFHYSVFRVRPVSNDRPDDFINFYLILPSILSLIFVYIVLHRIEKSLFLLQYTVTPVMYSLYITVTYRLYATGVTV